MADAIAPVLAARGIALVVRDVRDDPDLLRRYANDIPILLAGDVELARHGIAPDALIARLAALGVTRA